MKKAFLLLGVVTTLLAVKPAQAQFSYTFKDTTVAYVPLTGGTSINGGSVWDQEAYKITFPFAFKMDGTTQASIYLQLDATGLLKDTTDYSNLNGFLITDADLIDRGAITGTTSLSPIRSVLSGTAPNRIFKVEIANAGFYNEGDIYSTLNDSANIQMWFYETSNVIELRYGPSKITYPGDYYNFGNGPLIGELVNLDYTGFSSGKIYNLAGNAALPTLDSFVLPPTSAPNTLSNWPPNGKVYRFTPKTGTPPPSSVGTIAGLASVKVYPTRTVSALRVDYSGAAEADYAVLAADGRQVASGKLSGGSNSLDVRSLAAGMYLLQVRTAEGSGVYRFVKE